MISPSQIVSLDVNTEEISSLPTKKTVSILAIQFPDPKVYEML